ncbi:MAG: sugar ABC transporter ATP-binding protein [Planctomycetota bacterium]|jgi:ABC-type sugar transport system ATPase subunit|nr:sugar ABC transporter ATP-binding protein [Planctomycetota bacterium]
MAEQPILEIKHVSKSFAGNAVLRDISLPINKGEVHALVGENGAGKSTLMKIIGGILPADGGEIFFNGQAVRFENPMQALDAGISIVHQELSLAQNLTVAQNIYFRREITDSLGFIRKDAMANAARQVFKRIGVDIDPNVLIGRLSIGMQQLVEIAKAVSLDAKVIIMDEPTSSLSESETSHLFNLIRELVRNNVTIIYISHKISEVMELSHRVSVLRDGLLACSSLTSEITTEEIIHHMVGRELGNLYPPKGKNIGDTIMSCQKLSRHGFFRNVTFDLRKGEILGFYGLVGSGRTEVAMAMVGATPITSGEIRLDGRVVRFKNPRQAIGNGICYLTEDRKVLGLFLSMSVRLNATASILGRISNRLGFLRSDNMRHKSSELGDYMGVTPKNDIIDIINLSGGNQQKVLLGKWILTNPRVLIVDEPTRGVDVGAKSLIHAKIRELADKGMSVIMITSEMPECLGMSDRVAVFREGDLITVLDNPGDPEMQKNIMSYAVK